MAAAEVASVGEVQPELSQRQHGQHGIRWWRDGVGRKPGEEPPLDRGEVPRFTRGYTTEHSIARAIGNEPIGPSRAQVEGYPSVLLPCPLLHIEDHRLLT